ncbi:hypothetical protein GCM10025865_19930 [Paraoerskovia sediminicola]|uniref:SAF domain-containing protein n=1 Tax=Paraoerskovia sediminicola TaxID=1138587 RepID=A0ABM8G3N2_9CELL|nr:SAF domain-containing protein [Paraoerskovia sediminicola]BDZ42694.1 hypothetical protein GCM10025865_19930 [Paraoerskovia sediminicola]
MLVVAERIDHGATVTAAAVSVTRYPTRLVPVEALTRPEQAVGRRATTDLAAGTPLSDGLVAGGQHTYSAPAGSVVVPVRLVDPAIAELLVPGDTVDLVALDLVGEHDPTEGRIARSAVVTSGAGLGADTSGPTAASVLGQGAPEEAPLVLVAVSDDEAVAVARAGATSRIAAVLVP